MAEELVKSYRPGRMLIRTEHNFNFSAVKK